MDGHLVVIGFMGAGKTTVGQVLAARCSRPFIDIDARVVDEAGCSIPVIFETEGENGFREREHAAIVAAVREAPAVIATGGGAVLFDRNVELLQAAGTIIALEVSARTLDARLGLAADRPLWPSDPDARLALLASRSAIYARVADHIVPVDDRTPDEIASTILELVA